MVEVVSTTTVRRPRSEVFDYVTAIANWPIIDPMMAAMLEDPPNHPTSRGETFIGLGRVGPIQTKMLWTVVECTPPQHWTGDLVASKRSRLMERSRRRTNSTKLRTGRVSSCAARGPRKRSISTDFCDLHRSAVDLDLSAARYVIARPSWVD